ncbi:MAG: Ig-like domain-containing domain [Bacteroidota bacterium]
MKKQPFPSLLRPIFFCLLLTSLWQCANPIAPTGGPRDEEPPKVDSIKSDANYQTNYYPESIELTFNEWVKLNSPNQQIIISPPFRGYTTRLKGKTLILDLGDKDTLRSDVTYVIQFGEAVQDLTESNPTEDLRFIFSTGDYIDSLELSGQVIDAYNSEPAEDVLVLLYDNLVDTAFRTERPFYFGRTDEEGMFLISNLKSGTYRLMALKDADANYMYSQQTEPIAFFTEPIQITADSVPSVELRLFQEEIPLKLNEVDSSRFGLLKLVFNGPINQRLEQQSTAIYQQKEAADSLLIWHQEAQGWTLYLSSDTLYYDTLTVPAAPIEQALEQLDTLKVKLARGTPQQLYHRRPVRLSFSRPVAQLDSSKMSLLLDTFPERLSFELLPDSLMADQVNLQFSAKENSPYQLFMYPGAVTDKWGIANRDTLMIEWRTSELKRFGNLNLTFTAPSAETNYFVRLLIEGKTPNAVFTLNGQTTYEKQFTGLAPGDYVLEIIEDTNTNARWDSGSYDALRQPERVLIRPIESLRANWDVEASIDLENFITKTNLNN